MTLRGSTTEFPLESVIGLLAGTSKTGELQVRSDGKVGALGFAGGRLVAAVMEGDGGEAALGAIFGFGDSEFEFTPWTSEPEANLESGDLVTQLKRAAEARDRLRAIRDLIPTDRTRFRLSEKAADQGDVTFTPDRWRALLAVNGQRDVASIAEQLRLGKMQTLTLLSGLVKEGVIETITAPIEAPPPKAPEPELKDRAWESDTAAAPAPAPEAPPPAQDWAGQTWKPPETESAEPPSELRPDLQAELADRLGGFAEPPPPSKPEAAPKGMSPEPEKVPPAVDQRLSSHSGLFAPGPAANTQTAQEAKAPADPWGGAPLQPPARSADSWNPAPATASEAPANAWAPNAAPPTSATAPAQSQTGVAPKESTVIDHWKTPPPPAPATAPAAEAHPEKKKGGGFLGRFLGREESPAPTPIRADTTPQVTPARRSGQLASLSNALLVEYQSGGYGKGKIETRLANLLMRVDEQADPIDRPLPVVDDMIDAAALEREGIAEEQAVPYLATLVRQIYDDAERAFGKDKAKKGYKTALQQVFGPDASVVQSPDLAGKLPKA